MISAFRLLLLVFAFADSFKHGKPRFFCIGDRKRLEFVRRAETGNDFAHGFFTGRTFFQRRGGERTVQRKFATANHATTFAQFIFVKRHKLLR